MKSGLPALARNRQPEISSGKRSNAATHSNAERTRSANGDAEGEGPQLAAKHVSLSCVTELRLASFPVKVHNPSSIGSHLEAKIFAGVIL